VCKLLGEGLDCEIQSRIKGEVKRVVNFLLNQSVVEFLSRLNRKDLSSRIEDIGRGEINFYA
jgi:hypothetical protein